MMATLGLWTCLVLVGADDYGIVMESFPDPIQDRLERVARQAGVRLEAVLARDRLWKPGSEVTIAFRGGDDATCEAIAEVAAAWTAHGNLRLSYREPDGSLRRWSEQDKAYAADIRVAFDAPGHWSLIGNHSRDPQVVPPWGASLNLQGLDERRPDGWKGLVLHEFGHALGFLHEHQHPGGDCGFRFEDDKGYTPTTDDAGTFIPDANGLRPGIYSVLGGPPNSWPRDKVLFNLRRLENDESLILGSPDLDIDSVMIYDLPSWMFHDGEDSPCFTRRRSDELSTGDRKAMALAYPE